MILIGQYDSPFVRRVAIAMTLYGMDFEHRPWSVFSDAEKIRKINPLMRVPTLVHPDGAMLPDTISILAFLDERVEAHQVLLPVDPVARRNSRMISALASGISDKAVALFYELYFHDRPAKDWADRCRTQILGTLAHLEALRGGTEGLHLDGPRMGHADIAVAATLRHLREATPTCSIRPRFPPLATMRRDWRPNRCSGG